MARRPMCIAMAQYYRATLALPLLASPVVYLLGRSAILPAIPDIVWFSMILGGMPYLILATIMFFWVRGKPEKAIHQVIYLSPFFMVVLLAIAALVFLPALREGTAGDRGVASGIVRHAVFTLVIGYLYVAAVQSVYLALKAMRRITRC